MCGQPRGHAAFTSLLAKTVEAYLLQTPARRLILIRSAAVTKACSCLNIIEIMQQNSRELPTTLPARSSGHASFRSHSQAYYLWMAPYMRDLSWARGHRFGMPVPQIFPRSDEIHPASLDSVDHSPSLAHFSKMRHFKKISGRPLHCFTLLLWPVVHLFA